MTEKRKDKKSHLDPNFQLCFVEKLHEDFQDYVKEEKKPQGLPKVNDIKIPSLIKVSNPLQFERKVEKPNFYWKYKGNYEQEQPLYEASQQDLEFIRKINERLILNGNKQDQFTNGNANNHSYQLNKEERTLFNQTFFEFIVTI